MIQLEKIVINFKYYSDTASITIDCGNDSSKSMLIRETSTSNIIKISNITDGISKSKAEKYLGGLILDLIDNTAHICDRINKSNVVMLNIRFN